MLSIGMYMTIITLWKQGKNKKEIARLLDLDRKTVRKIIRSYEEEGTDKPTKATRVSIVAPYKEKIESYLERDLSGIRIYEELQALGFKAKYRTLCEYIFKLKESQDICIRFHTQAGEEAQVDFGYVGILLDDNEIRRKGWIFNMRLSYSRLDYYELVFDQKVKTFIECHTNAFRYFGGVPKIVKIDNLKAAILEASFYEPVYQELYKQFSQHYGFDPIPCRVRKPQEKGKVEAGIKYVKNNFFAGRKFTTHTELLYKLNAWVENICNSRIHGTTKKVPRDLFEQEEKAVLIPLPLNDFISEITIRKVCKDCHITVSNNYYSVPYEYVGKMVEVQQDSKMLKIYHESKQIAVHIKSCVKGEFITNNAHYPKYKVFSHESLEYRAIYKEKMQGVGIYADKLFCLILEQQPQSWYRTTKGILSLKKTFPDRIIELACQRSLLFNITSYRKVKNICESGSYNLPIDQDHYIVGVEDECA